MKESDILYENGDYCVYRHIHHKSKKPFYEVIQNGITHGHVRATIGEGPGPNLGLSRAIAECDKRAAAHKEDARRTNLWDLVEKQAFPTDDCKYLWTLINPEGERLEVLLDEHPAVDASVLVNRLRNYQLFRVVAVDGGNGEILVEYLEPELITAVLYPHAKTKEWSKDAET